MQTIQEEKDLFYQHIGVAITQWAHVEHALFGIFATCLAHEDIKSAATVFFSAVTLQSKITLVDEQIHYRHLGSTHLKTWRSLQERIKRLSKSRNHLAHFAVLGLPSAEPGKRYRLQPSLHIPKEPGAQPKYYYVNDFPAVWASYSKLMCALENFNAQLQGSDMPFPREA